MTAGDFVWILLFVTCACLIWACLSTVLVFKMSTRAIRATMQAHDSNKEYTAGLVDRIVSGDWQTYKAYEMMGRPQPEVEEAPRIEEVPIGDVRGGFGSRLGLAAMGRRLTTEEEMIEEIDNAGR